VSREGRKGWIARSAGLSSVTCTDMAPSCQKACCRHSCTFCRSKRATEGECGDDLLDLLDRLDIRQLHARSDASRYLGTHALATGRWGIDSPVCTSDSGATQILGAAIGEDWKSGHRLERNAIYIPSIYHPKVVCIGTWLGDQRSFLPPAKMALL
jgi:hypothetical protein